jgi:hypothetical protein
MNRAVGVDLWKHGCVHVHRRIHRNSMMKKNALIVWLYEGNWLRTQPDREY